MSLLTKFELNTISSLSGNWWDILKQSEDIEMVEIQWNMTKC